MNALTRFILFGNYLYGFCAVALSIEASLQQHSALNSLPYYFFVFVSTILYYTHAYIAEPGSNPANKRANWYFEHRVLIRRTQILLTVLFVFTGIYLARQNFEALLQINLLQWFLIFIFPVGSSLVLRKRFTGKINA